jgi:hypothetical protein
MMQRSPAKERALLERIEAERREKQTPMLGLTAKGLTEPTASAPPGAPRAADPGAPRGRADAGAPADEWGDWIEWAGGECPIPDTKAGEYMVRFDHGVCYAYVQLDARELPEWRLGHITAYRLKRRATLLDQAIKPDLPPECLAAEVREGDGPWIALADLADDAVVVRKGECWEGLRHGAQRHAGNRWHRSGLDLMTGVFHASRYTHVRIVAPEASA